MLIHSPNDLARQYRDLRKQRRISQSSIAAETALRQDTVSKFELKADNVRLDTLFRLLAALDLELHIESKAQPVNDEKEKSGWTESW
jgi:HTH-type transcriptional regulator/antitoxin HipB